MQLPFKNKSTLFLGKETFNATSNSFAEAAVKLIIGCNSSVIAARDRQCATYSLAVLG
jgi:hypothetical protein